MLLVLLIAVLSSLASSQDIAPVDIALPDPSNDATDCTDKFCQCYAHPDPHFKTWRGTYFDYHGGCDVVMVKHPALNLHIRTKRYAYYASIANAAVQVGPDIFELTDNGDMYFNKVLQVLPPATVGGKVLSVTNFLYQDSYEIIITGGETPQTVVLSVSPSHPELGVSAALNLHGADFGDASGMCGTWRTPGLASRDETYDFLSNVCPGTAFGEHWQVNTATDGDLFVNPPNSTLCEPPLAENPRLASERTCGSTEQSAARNLRSENNDGGHLERQLQSAMDKCASVVPPGAPAEVLNNCVYDLTVTMNDDFLRSAFYRHPVELRIDQPRCLPTGNRCKKAGGTCVLGCDKTKNLCINALCYDKLLVDDMRSLAKYMPNACACALPKCNLSPGTVPTTNPAP